MTNRHPQAGFTLIEVSLVMLILGVMLTLVVPRLPDIGAQRHEDATARLAAMMEYLADEAALRGRIYRLQLDLDGSSYHISSLSALAPRTTDEDASGSDRNGLSSGGGTGSGPGTGGLGTGGLGIGGPETRSCEPDWDTTIPDAPVAMEMSDAEFEQGWDAYARDGFLPEDLYFEEVSVGGEITTEGNENIYFLPEGPAAGARIRLTVASDDNAGSVARGGWEIRLLAASGIVRKGPITGGLR